MALIRYINMSILCGYGVAVTHQPSKLTSSVRIRVSVFTKHGENTPPPFFSVFCEIADVAQSEERDFAKVKVAGS